MGRLKQGEFLMRISLRSLTINDRSSGESRTYGECQAAELHVSAGLHGRECRVADAEWIQRRLRTLHDFGFEVLGVCRSEEPGYAATVATRWLKKRGRYERQQNAEDPRALVRADAKGVRADLRTAEFWACLSPEERVDMRIDYPMTEWPLDPSTSGRGIRLSSRRQRTNSDGC
jgi:hypothetical protein